MTDEIASEIQRAFVESWYKFIDYYNKLAPEYSRDLNKEDKESSHWICWNEYDLMFHIGKLFYNILGLKEGSIYSNIQIHFEKNVNISNFRGYEFENRLDELKERLKMKRGPKIDMIVADETSDNSFLLCSELKFFHGPSRYESPIQQINRDVQKLKAMKELKIARKAIFVLLDDYYYCTEKNTSDGILDTINNLQKDEKDITILYSNTLAKLKEYT